MNISKKPKTLKTADGYIPKAGDTLYYLNHHMNGCWIYKFECKHWHSGGLVNFCGLEDTSKEPHWVNMTGYPKGFYPAQENNVYSILYYLDVYKDFNNAVKSYENRIKKMSKIKLVESECKIKKTTYEY